MESKLWICEERGAGSPITPSCAVTPQLQGIAEQRRRSGGTESGAGGGGGEERNRWERKRIMLHNQAVYFSAWNGEHKKRCLDAFIVGASFGWLCHRLLPKI